MQLLFSSFNCLTSKTLKEKKDVCQTLFLILVQFFLLITLYYPIVCFTSPSNLLYKFNEQQCQVRGSKSLFPLWPRKIPLHTGGYYELKQGFCEDNDELCMCGCVHAGASLIIEKGLLFLPGLFFFERSKFVSQAPAPPLCPSANVFSRLQCNKISRHEMTS